MWCAGVREGDRGGKWGDVVSGGGRGRKREAGGAVFAGVNEGDEGERGVVFVCGGQRGR